MNKFYLLLGLTIWVSNASFGLSHGSEIHKDHDDDLVSRDSSAEESKSEPATPQHNIAMINESYKKVLPLFRRACFDCHSDQTVFPWYFKLPVVSGIITRDIEEAKSHIIFGPDYPFQGHGNLLSDLDAIFEVIRSDSMPPLRYKIMHWDSFLNKDEKNKIYQWIESAKKNLNQKPLAQ